jgi:hypothetical protein
VFQLCSVIKREDIRHTIFIFNFFSDLQKYMGEIIAKTVVLNKYKFMNGWINSSEGRTCVYFEHLEWPLVLVIRTIDVYETRKSSKITINCKKLL